MKKKQEKLPRSIVIANNKKQKDIKNILKIKEDMIENNFNKEFIDGFINDQYNKINLEHELRIKKYNEKVKKKINNSLFNEIKKKRNKAIEFLLKNKTFLEERGATKEYIKNYVDKQYQEINEYYSFSNFKEDYYDVNYDNLDFID